MWKIYILECRDKTLYTGITLDINRRLKEHNGEISGGAKYTKARQPVKLLYLEELENRSEASKREIEIKKLSKTRKLKLVYAPCKSFTR